jgi:hypothetical protein
VRLVRANFEANLISYTGSVMSDNTEAYKAQLEQSIKAGAPIAQHDSLELSKALEIRAEIEAEALKCETLACEAKPTVKERELVTA